MLGVVAPDGGRITLLRQDPTGQTCTLGVAHRGSQLTSDWAEIVAAAPEQGPSNGIRPGAPSALSGLLGGLFRASTDCTPEMAAWMDEPQRQTGQNAAGHVWIEPRLLFSDASFVPAFGKPFRQLSESERDNLAMRMRTCLMKPDVRNRAGRNYGVLMSAFMDMQQFSNFEKNAAALSLASLRDWTRQLRDSAQKGAAVALHPLLPRAAAQSAAPLLAHLWPAERADLDRSLGEAQRPLAVAWLLRRVESAPRQDDAAAWESWAAQIVQARTGFGFLTADDLAPVSTRMAAQTAEMLPALAERSASQAGADPREIEALIGWPAAHRNLWAVASAAAQAQGQAVIDQRKAVLVDTLVTAERRALTDRLRGLEPVAVVKELVASEARMAARLGRLQAEPASERFAAERSAQRIEALSRGVDALLPEIEKAATGEQVDQIANSVLVASDAPSEPAIRIQRAAAKRKSALLAQALAAQERERAAAVALQAQQAERERQLAAERQREQMAALGSITAADRSDARQARPADCAALAASPDERRWVAGVVGVEFDRIDAVRAVPACAAAVAAAPTDATQLFRYCRALRKAGRFAHAALACRSAAERQHALAAFALYSMAHHGEAGASDTGAKFRWLEAAAEGGYADAQTQLGLEYDSGENVRKDYAVAFMWLQRAAKQDDAVALYYVAFAYANGRGVGRDTDRAEGILSQLLTRLRRDGEPVAGLTRSVQNGLSKLADARINKREAEYQEQRANDRLRDIWLGR